jgi:Zn-dependent protease
MFLSLLFSSPGIAVAWLLAIVIALTVHEFSHALVGKWRGDKTAEREGRLTLNPMAHLDPIGALSFLLIGFGWAKPVPFNPYNLKNPKWDSVAIALAGPASNFLMAAIAALAIRLLVGGQIITELNLLIVFLFLLILVNLFLLFFNAIPVHPLDGSKLAFALLDQPQHARIREFLYFRGPQILLFLVALSFFGVFDPFSFITTFSFGTCNVLLGDNCSAFFTAIFSTL